MTWLGGARVLLASTRKEGCQPHTRAFSSLPSHVPVMVVGAGPVGLVLSILLSKLGIQTVLIEKQVLFSQHPQAHFINNRTMEIFRKLNGLSRQIESIQPPLDHWRKFVYCTTLVGPVLGIVDHLKQHDPSQVSSPTWVGHLSQHRLLALLRERAEKDDLPVRNMEKDINATHETHVGNRGGIHMGCECISLKETSGGVVVGVAVHGEGLQENVACDFLIGTDGASSSVRRLLGLKMEGERELQNLISIHFLSKELGRELAQHRPAMLYFVFNPSTIGVVVAHDLRIGEFVVQVPFFPPQQCVQDFTNQVCKNIIQGLVGHDVLDIGIKAVKPWVMHAEVVEHYLSRHGKVILAGDAAHRFPPAGGFGMNTGIQDAHNLAWKLAAVLSGAAPPALLHTYEAERRPIAQANTALSISNFNAAMSIPSALGLDPQTARFIHRAMNNEVVSFLPHSFRKAALEGIFAMGRAQLTSYFLNRSNPFAASRLEKVKKILECGQSLQLQFPAEDLGFRYRSGALVPEKTAAEDVNAHDQVNRKGNILICQPGSRLPHLDIELLTENAERVSKGICSTLDLSSIDQVEFLLFVGANRSGVRWSDAFLYLAKGINIQLKVGFVWPKGSSRLFFAKRDMRTVLDSSGSDTLSSNKNVNNSPIYGIHDIQQWRWRNRHCIIDVEDLSDNWWNLCQIPPAGAMLVRPDDHIAWISRVDYSMHTFDELSSIFTTILQKHASGFAESRAFET